MTIAVDQGIDFDALAKALDNEETVTERRKGVSDYRRPRASPGSQRCWPWNTARHA